MELRGGELGRIIEWQWQSGVGYVDRDRFNAVDKVIDRQRLFSLGGSIFNSLQGPQRLEKAQSENREKLESMSGYCVA